MHTTVLLDEAVEALITDKNGLYVDATFGRGGHSKKILQGLEENGRLLAIDKDLQAIKTANEIAESDNRLHVQQGSFSQLNEFVTACNWGGDSVHGVLLDLGVSSPQLDEAQRGFSFMREGPLDMRMDTTRGQTAAQWLAVAEAQEICDVLRKYGEERFAWRIAKNIVETREESPVQTTLQLAKLIEDAVPFKERGKHPATRSFQAIRIYINQELQDLEILLEKVSSLLCKGGRLVVISFHSLEDRIVKQFINAQQKGPEIPAYLPITDDQVWQPLLKKVGKPVKPSQQEIENNVRARSAIMRIAEKVK